jgi:hypothetical protein
MQDTVDPAAAPPRTLAQIIEDARRAELAWRRCRRSREGQCKRPGNPPP